MPSVLLVEDHAIVAKALSRMLHERGNIDVISVAESAEKTLEELPKIKDQLDLLLVDVSLPRMSGIELVDRIQKQYPGLPCLMLSGHMSSHYVQRSLAAGARGYVIKDNISGILEGINQVLAGGMYLSEELRE
jgi:DNA-binding NarL/FixJ family response regulator